ELGQKRSVFDQPAGERSKKALGLYLISCEKGLKNACERVREVESNLKKKITPECLELQLPPKASKAELNRVVEQNNRIGEHNEAYAKHIYGILKDRPVEEGFQEVDADYLNKITPEVMVFNLTDTVGQYNEKIEKYNTLIEGFNLEKITPRHKK